MVRGSQNRSFWEEKILNGGVGTSKKVNFSQKGAGIRREKGGVSICTYKKLVAKPRRLVQITIVSLWVRRDHQLRLNETKMASETFFRVINNKTRVGVTLGKDS
jgi:hypothetical protein